MIGLTAPNGQEIVVDGARAARIRHALPHESTGENSGARSRLELGD